MDSKRKARPAAKGKADSEELGALAHHLAEALRIMRESELVPARIYNYFADAWNKLVSVSLSSRFFESEEHARVILAELARKGGAE